MAQSAPSHPPLTPQFCFNTRALKDFLRISRSSVDDSITQNLNALSEPVAFNPSTASQRSLPSTNRRRISPESCRTFKESVLFPSWQTRSDVLNYCASVATSPDPDDPEAAIQQLEAEKAGQRIIDERLDPYSARYFPRESRTETLAAVIRQERGVERIVRARSWGLFLERCGDDWREWEDALGQWKKSAEKRQ